MLIVDCLLPGAGLIVRGRLLIGSLLLLCAVMALSVGAVLAIVSTGALLYQVLVPLICVYGVLVMSALALRFVDVRRQRYDQQQVRQLYERCSQQFLSGATAEALVSARQLCAHCSTLLGPWQLLVHVAEAAGAHAVAAKAHKKVAELMASE